MPARTCQKRWQVTCLLYALDAKSAATRTQSEGIVSVLDWGLYSLDLRSSWGQEGRTALDALPSESMARRDATNFSVDRGELLQRLADWSASECELLSSQLAAPTEPHADAEPVAVAITEHQRASRQ